MDSIIERNLSRDEMQKILNVLTPYIDQKVERIRSLILYVKKHFNMSIKISSAKQFVESHFEDNGRGCLKSWVLREYWIE